MTMTLLQIAQIVGQRMQLPIISTVYGSTDNNMTFLLSMIEKTVNEVKDEFPWPELTKEHTFTLVNGQASYSLPSDYDRRLNQTLWNRTQALPLVGPMTAVEWQQYKSGLVATIPIEAFRVSGFAAATFNITPTPTSGEAGQTCVFEYISAHAIQTGSGPATYGERFTADTNVVLLDPWMIVDGTVWRYKRERGQDYEDLRADALSQLESTKTKIMGAGILSLNGVTFRSLMVGPWSYPQGNYYGI